MTLIEIKKLKTKHNKEIAVVIREYIKSKADKLKIIKKLMYIEQGKSGYRDGVYSRLRSNIIDSGEASINVETAEIESIYLRSRKAGDEYLASLSINSLDIDEVYECYKKDVYEEGRSAYGHVLSFEEFITRAILLDIDLDFKDFDGHYKRLSDLSEKQFLDLKDNITSKVAELLLRGVYEEDLFDAPEAFIECEYKPVIELEHE